MKPEGKRKKSQKTAPQPENWRELQAWGQKLLDFSASGDSAVLRWRPTDDELRDNPFGMTLADYANETDPWHFLGEALIAIAHGADAREVFGQKRNSRGRPNREFFRRARSGRYWLSRIEGKPHRDALNDAARQFQFVPPPALTSIYRDAQKDKKDSLSFWRRAGRDTSQLEAQLAKKGRRGRFQGG